MRAGGLVARACNLAGNAGQVASLDDFTTLVLRKLRPFKFMEVKEQTLAMVFDTDKRAATVTEIRNSRVVRLVRRTRLSLTATIVVVVVVVVVAGSMMRV